MTSYLTSIDNIYLSRTVFEILDYQSFMAFDLDLRTLEVIWCQKHLCHSNAHIWLPIWLLWTTSLSRTVFEIFDFKVFRVWLGPLTPKGHLGSKNFIPFESPYMTSYLTSIDTISLSRTVFEIFDFKVFRVWPWPLTPENGIRRKGNSTKRDSGKRVSAKQDSAKQDSAKREGTNLTENYSFSFICSFMVTWY